MDLFPHGDYFWANQSKLPRSHQIRSSVGSPKEKCHQNGCKGWRLYLLLSSLLMICLLFITDFGLLCCQRVISETTVKNSMQDGGKTFPVSLYWSLDLWSGPKVVHHLLLWYSHVVKNRFFRFCRLDKPASKVGFWIFLKITARTISFYSCYLTAAFLWLIFHGCTQWPEGRQSWWDMCEGHAGHPGQ